MRRAGFPDLWIKDESGNPTGSFKARGLSAAISKAKELGRSAIAVPTAGNAGGAAAAYAARAGMDLRRLHAGRHSADLFRVECERYGARVTLVPGLIDACGKLVAEGAARDGWLDVSTLKEPYRVEGKKTMGYELAEDFGWKLPDAMIYPTGGGTGLIGMWKAFEEMERLGLDRPGAAEDDRRPGGRLRADRRRPSPRGADVAEKVGERVDLRVGPARPETVRRLPHPRDRARSPGGDAIAVTDDEMRVAEDEIGRAEGLFVCPGGSRDVGRGEEARGGGSARPGASRVVLFNTGTGFKYA